MVDVGGTRLRFAVARPNGSGVTLERVTDRRADDYPNFYAALADYLAGLRGMWPDRVAIAVAAPIAGDEAVLTNRGDWRIRKAALGERFGFADAALVNDFVALARALPLVPDKDLRPIGDGRPVEDAPIAVIGPGTGLGMALVVPTGSGLQVVASEGGHATFAPETEREIALARSLQWRHGHVSWERVLSGPGIAEMHEILSEIDHGVAQPMPPETISAHALQGIDRRAVETLQMFAGLLGSFAGNVALAAGARGGVYIGGGIVPQLADFIARSSFRDRFEAKGRFNDYLAAIPTVMLLTPEPTLLGLAATLWPDLRIR